MILTVLFLQRLFEAPFLFLQLMTKNNQVVKKEIAHKTKTMQLYLRLYNAAKKIFGCEGNL